MGAFGRERRAGQEGEGASATGGREHGSRQPDLSTRKSAIPWGSVSVEQSATATYSAV